MSETQKDAARSVAASAAILDGRDPVKDMAPIMVTLETVVATVLLATQNRDPGRAVAMLTEGLVPRLEERLALFASRARKQ